MLRLHPRTGGPDFGVENWGGGVTEQSVTGQSVTSGKCDGAESRSGRKDWGVDSK